MYMACVYVYYVFIVDTFDCIYMFTEINIEALKKQTGTVSHGHSLYTKVIGDAKI